MIIKSFSIIDYKNKEAASYKFSDQINLVVSQDNTMGKSSLLKSLYFNLGFQIKQFPSKWNPTDMFFQITVIINGKKHIISRQNKLFKIDGRNEPLNEREYSDWLQEKLNTNMELPNVRNKELSNAYSSAVILPFYIDQDDSWDGIMYRRVSNALGQYHNIPQTIFEYLFGLSDIDIQKLQNDLNIEL
ncbi:endonuclease, partial [Pseudogracilibacillus auburnensis]|nr:endonuclease [Pseudogracilibacillus auburnensis]